MKYVITEERLTQIASKYVSDKLNSMTIRQGKIDKEDIYFKDKNTENNDYGIECEWIHKEQGYIVNVGSKIWDEVKNIFDLEDYQLNTIFTEVIEHIIGGKIIDLMTFHFPDI